MRFWHYLATGFASLLLTAAGAGVVGAKTTGQPYPWQMGFQAAATPVKHEMAWFHDMLLAIITLISLLVLGLLIYVMVKFNAKANPTPSRTTHNTVIEVLWTVVPIVILLIVTIPSVRLLYFQNTVPENAEITIKAIGHQWYWSYEYPDDGFGFDALMVDEASLQDGQPRLLTADNAVVVPTGKIVRLIATADDVIHAWAIPAFGVKVDTVPGKLNEAWFQVERPGIYYGQCSELCGVNHAFMPIEVHAVTAEEYDAWLTTAKEEYAHLDDGNGVGLAERAQAR